MIKLMVYNGFRFASKEFRYSFVPLIMLIFLQLIISSSSNIGLKKSKLDSVTSVNKIQEEDSSPKHFNSHKNFIHYDKAHVDTLSFECEIEEIEVEKKKQNEKGFVFERINAVRKNRKNNIDYCRVITASSYSCDILLFTKIFRI